MKDLVEILGLDSDFDPKLCEKNLKVELEERSVSWKCEGKGKGREDSKPAFKVDHDMKDEQISDSDNNYQDDHGESDSRVYLPTEQETNFPCSYCPKKFSTQNRANCHMSLSHDQKNYFQEHIEEVEDKFSCKICRKSYEKRRFCVAHLKRSHGLGETWNCEICGKNFTQKWHYKVHVLKHAGKRDHICDLCGNAFVEKSHLARHIVKLHGSEQEKEAKRKFVCTTCGKGFYSKFCLTDHEFIHLDHNSFFCDECEAGYKTKNALRLHKNKAHLGKYLPTEEQRKKQNMMKVQRNADKKARNGSIRTPEEKIKFNEYMRNYQAKKRMQKQIL